MDPELLDRLLSIMASAGGALLAGLLGVRLGLAKLRGERAFDRRLQWYEEATQATREYAVALNRVVHEEREPTSESDRLGAWLRLSEVMDRFFKVLPQSHMYTSRRVHNSLRTVAEGGDELARTIANDKTPHPNHEQLAALWDLRELMLRTSNELTHELRRHLGLDDLRGAWYARIGAKVNNRPRYQEASRKVEKKERSDHAGPA